MRGVSGSTSTSDRGRRLQVGARGCASLSSCAESRPLSSGSESHVPFKPKQTLAQPQPEARLLPLYARRTQEARGEGSDSDESDERPKPVKAAKAESVDDILGIDALLPLSSEAVLFGGDKGTKVGVVDRSGALMHTAEPAAAAVPAAWDSDAHGMGSVDIRIHPRLRMLVVHKMLPIGLIFLPGIDGGPPVPSTHGVDLAHAAARAISDVDSCAKLGLHPHLLHLVGAHKPSWIFSKPTGDDESDSRPQSATSRFTDDSSVAISEGEVPAGMEVSWVHGCEQVWEFVEGTTLRQAIDSGYLYSPLRCRFRKLRFEADLDTDWVDAHSRRMSRLTSAFIDEEQETKEAETLNSLRSQVESRRLSDGTFQISPVGRLLDIAIQLAWVVEHLRSCSRLTWGLGMEDIVLRTRHRHLTFGHMSSQAGTLRSNDDEDTVLLPNGMLHLTPPGLCRCSLGTVKG